MTDMATVRPGLRRHIGYHDHGPLGIIDIDFFCEIWSVKVSTTTFTILHNFLIDVNDTHNGGLPMVPHTDRRTVLKTTGGLLTGMTIFPGSISAQETGQETQVVHEGESVNVGGGSLMTYATTDSMGNVVSLGVHLDDDAVTSFAQGGSHHEKEVGAHVHFPTETTDGNALDHQFTFQGFHYNPEGHPPPEIYDIPHFDFHFYMLEDKAVEAISGGPLGETPMPFIGLADYEIPDAQRPPGYMFEKHRFIVEEMGEHLLDATAPEFNGETFTHTYVYGIHDPSIDPANPDRTKVITLGDEDVEMPVYTGDGQGQVHFVEPMVTTDFIRNGLTRAREVGVATPAQFPTGGAYPTTYGMRPDGQGGVHVTISDFKQFPGPSQ